VLILISCVQELDETGVYVQVVVQVYVGVLLSQAVVQVLVGYGSDSPVWLEWAWAVVASRAVVVPVPLVASRVVVLVVVLAVQTETEVALG
jgi:hypothetical protein